MSVKSLKGKPHSMCRKNEEKWFDKIKLKKKKSNLWGRECEEIRVDI